MKTHCFQGVKRLISISLLTLLSLFSFNVAAGELTYVGNPMRPDTYYMKADCCHRCHENVYYGYYIKFLNPPVCSRKVSQVVASYEQCRCGYYHHHHHCYYRVYR